MFKIVLICILLQSYVGGKPVKPTISSHPIILVVSFDGFRSDYFEHTQLTPWLNALRASGVTVPYMDPVFPTETFPNHISIATGLNTESHGIVANEVFDPAYNRTLSGYNDDPEFWNYNPDVLPIWIRNEMAGEGRTSGCLMWAGSSTPYGPNSDLLPTYYYPAYDSSVPWESRVDTVISWITNETNPANLVFMYYDEPDTHGHAFGPNSAETLAEVEKADNRTAYLVNKLIHYGIYEDVNLILLSDHGMAPVTSQRIIYLETMIDNDSLIKYKDGGTPVLRLTPHTGKEEDLYKTLKELSSQNNFTVWKKEEMREPFYYSDNRRIGDLVVVADPGYAFDDFNSTIEYYLQQPMEYHCDGNDSLCRFLKFTGNETTEYGVHGYSNQASSMRPFFIANGPAFKTGVEHPPFKNVDIVPLISAIIGIPDVPTNGSLSRVTDMIE